MDYLGQALTVGEGRNTQSDARVPYPNTAADCKPIRLVEINHYRMQNQSSAVPSLRLGNDVFAPNDVESLSRFASDCLSTDPDGLIRARFAPPGAGAPLTSR